MVKTKKFKKLLKSTKEYYVGRKVPPKYRERYKMITINRKAVLKTIPITIAYIIGMTFTIVVCNYLF